MLRFGTMIVAALLAAGPAKTQSVADFYRGKTVNVLIGVGVGGEYDLQARLVARHIGKHIPGNPTVVPQNMTGAGGIKMIELSLHASAEGRHQHRHDRQRFSGDCRRSASQGVQFDAAKCSGSARIAPVVETMAVWHTDRRQEHRGCRATRDGRRRLGTRRHHLHLSVDDERVPRHQIQDRHRLSRRQPDQPRDGAQRGQARNNTWSSWKATKPTGCEDKKITVIAQAGPRAPDLDAPSVEDAGQDTGGSPADRARRLRHPSGRPFATTPEAPADRVAALRAAFAATMADPEFLAESRESRLRARSGARARTCRRSWRRS